ncbi:MAG: toll/interleukin-1 receptor domain-containing protein [Chloroflexi bacterium]|nr:toll/interleukin-1 receptor domain-containing protein [Chloroflexota bacterium]
MSHIFISYSKQDIDFARYLRALLENEGFAVWMDEKGIEPSEDWWESIEQGILSCGALLVIMSGHARESRWIKREILLAEDQGKRIFPVLLDGKVWPRLADIQYEDMRAGLRAKLSAAFLNALRAALPTPSAAGRSVTFTITNGNIVDFAADVIALKHARNFYGSDALVTRLLELLPHIDVEQLHVLPGEHCLIETEGAITAPKALYVGTAAPRQFGYQQIHDFAYQVLEVLAYEAPQTRHLAMTIHGPGFGLDEREALRSQVAGYLDALRAGALPPALERITILEISDSRVARLRAVMDADLRDSDEAAPLAAGWGYLLHVPEPADTVEPPDNTPVVPAKRHAFVAMPVRADTDDLFYYGIQTPIHALGLLCERVEQSNPTEDLLDQIKRRIETAAVFVADLTDPDPGVYLQLGYAWGKGRPTILLAKAGSRLALETARPTPIFYDRIKEIESALAQSLDALKAQGLL